MAICAAMQGQKVGPSEDEDASKTSKENKPHEEKKESILTKKESRKFKRNKSDKKGTEKIGVTKFEGEGIIFKAKLIGVEDIDEARGDQLCQDALHRLKAAVKSSGTHKTRITLSVSLEGIKIKDDRTGDILYHHPVHKISFISQDISDSRAFGYIFSLSQTGHQFVGVKTEKMAAHVVIALRDLFQTVLELKKKEMVKVETQQKNQTITLNDREYPTDETDSVTDSNSTEPIYSEVQERTTEPIIDLLDLRTELDQLQEGIAQMNDSIAAYPLHVQQPILFPQKLETVEEKVNSSTANEASFSEKIPTQQDKYAVFSEIDTVPSLFDNPSLLPQVLPEPNFGQDILPKDPSEIPLEIPATNSTTKPIDFSLFEDLDPLGKGRPFVSKENFFRNIKTPPKKTLKDFPGSSDSMDTPPNSPNVSLFDDDMCAPPTPPLPNPFGSPPPRIPPRSPPVVVDNGIQTPDPFCDRVTFFPPPLASRSSEPTFPMIPSPPPRPSPRKCATPSPLRQNSAWPAPPSPLSFRRPASESSDSDMFSTDKGRVVLAADFPITEISSPNPFVPFPTKQNSFVQSSFPFDSVSVSVPSEVSFAMSPPPPNGTTTPVKRVAAVLSSPLSPEERSIFRKTQDPFADDFFMSLAKSSQNDGTHLCNNQQIEEVNEDICEST